jgi:serine phosphatase RsbU (regulator of sigma subunit)
MATRYSLYKFYPKQKILKKREFGNDKTMLFNQNSFYADANGELMFGTNRNVLIYKENNETENLPKVNILKIKLYDTLLIKKQTDFKSGKYDISFEFSALYLKNSEDVRFSYILEGRDTKWSEPSNLRIANYFGLTEGDYTFRVRAYNGSGFTSNNFASYIFHIDKPVWKKMWFWLIVVILLVAIIYMIVRVRTATLLHAKLRLEKLVDKKTEELREEKELVEAKNEIIEEQNKDITSSITYAKRIQEALLPDKNLDEKIKSKILIYYKPKDIVSGDFYWITDKGDRYLFAACDCTGHGVPGAFMSMIGTTLLNKIVFDNNESRTDRIISEMDNEISKSLHQENTQVNDGMEAALCSIDFENSTIEFTGAKRPLYLFRKQKEGYILEEYKGDKYPIGGFTDILDKTFTFNQIKAQKGDMIYLFSDGLIDQFSEANTGRIGSKRVRELLGRIVELPLNEQWKQLDDYISNWKGTRKQTDDILLLGIRL